MTTCALNKVCYTIMALIGVMVLADFSLLAYSLVTG